MLEKHNLKRAVNIGSGLPDEGVQLLTLAAALNERFRAEFAISDQ